MGETKGKRKAKPPRKPAEIVPARDEDKQTRLPDEADEVVPFVDEEAAAEDEEQAAEDALGRRPRRRAGRSRGSHGRR